MKNYQPPVKPAKLDANCVWVTVHQVHQADGFGPHEKTWACEYIGWNDEPDKVLKSAAEKWWISTDQSGWCDVTFAIEWPDGRVKVQRVHVRPSVEVVVNIRGDPWADAGALDRQAGPAFEAMAKTNEPGPAGADRECAA